MSIVNQPDKYAKVVEPHRRIVSIQYLRAISAFGVLVFHASGLRVGAAGVDVFFIISGFVMTVGAQQRRHRIGRFAADRIIRIAPLYWLVTIGLAAIARLLPSLFRRLRPELPDVLTSIFFIPHLDENGQAWPLLVQGWTLNLEILFYAIIAFSLILSRNRSLFVVSALALLAISSIYGDRNSPWTRTYFNPMFLEFLMGIVAGQLWNWRALPRPWTALALMMTAFAMLAATSFLGADLSFALPRTPEWERVLVWGAPAFLLAIGALGYEFHGGLRGWWPLLLLGNASYALYLVQGIVIAALGRLGGRYPFLIIVPTAVCLAIAVHLLIEQPMTTRLKRWTRAGRMNAASDGASDTLSAG